MKARVFILLLLAPLACAQTAPDMASAPRYRQFIGERLQISQSCLTSNFVLAIKPGLLFQ